MEMLHGAVVTGATESNKCALFPVNRLTTLLKSPESKASLSHWYTEMEKGICPISRRSGRYFHTPAESCTVFNVGGNKARIITAIYYNRKKVYIRHVLTHSEYDQWSR
jgi:mRNA interferase HigB